MMKMLNAMGVIAILLVVGLCYADRQKADEQAHIRDAKVEQQNKAKSARQVEWVDLDKVGRYLTAFDKIK